MRHLQVIASILCLWLSAGTASLANTVVYTPPADNRAGTISGQLPLGRLGSLILPRGTASLAGDELQILAVPAWLFDRVMVLRGAIVRAESITEPADTRVGGLIYFFDGQWLPNLSKSKAAEQINTIDGGTVSGHITGRSDAALLIRKNNGNTQTVAFSQILNIKSPRAFRFNFSSQSVQLNPTDGSMLFDSNQITMSQLTPQSALATFSRPSIPRSNLPGTELALSNRALAAFLAIDLLVEAAPAIVTPLVLNQSNLNAAENAIERFDAQHGQPDRRH
jgi:hypothetical protein